MELTLAQRRAKILQEQIECLCIFAGLNLTVYDGCIGFVDQKENKIVMTWKPEYTMEDLERRTSQ